MAIDFPTLIYEPCMEIFARPVVITPLISQPGAAPYAARGIFDTNPMEIDALDDSFITNTRTELDILEMEFPVLPMQDDRISIPEDNDVPGGEFIVSDVADKGNAGGEVTLVLKRLEEWRLVGGQFFIGALDFGEPKLTVSAGPNFSLQSPIIAIVPLTVIS